MKIESALTPPRYPELQVVALKALYAGEATPTQQKLALEYILNELSGVNNLSYRPDSLGGERDTAFAEGRRHVGFYIRKIVTTKTEDLIS